MMILDVNETNYLEQRKKGSIDMLSKFQNWDNLLKRKMDIKEFKAKAAYLWRDPSTWAYAILKDKQNLPLRPYYYQDVIMNDDHRFIHCTASNQVGKTWSLGIIKGLHHAYHVNNASVMLISRSENQAKGILDEMKWMMKRARIAYTAFEDEVKNRFEYHIQSPDGKGTSAIRVFPPTTSILSFPATLIVMDETGFWKKSETDLDPISFYQQCVEPRTNDTKRWKHPFLTMGQIVSITNPNGQDGLAWWLSENKKFHNYRFNWLARPGNEIDEYNQHKRELPPIRFASVYAAEYMLSSGGFIDQAEYQRFAEYNTKLAIPPSTIFLGGDFSSEDPKHKNTDFSTLYGVVHVPNRLYPRNPRIRLVYYNEFPPRTKREVIYNEIDRIKNLDGVYIAKFGYDRVGVGDSVKRDLVGMGILSDGQIEALTYSLPNKSDVYLNFQNLFKQDMIEGTHIPKLELQILALKTEKPVGSPHIKVHHKTEGVKDDHPDALANACFVAKQYYSHFESKYVVKDISVPQDATDSEKNHVDNVKRGITSNNQFFDYLKKNSQFAGF